MPSEKIMSIIWPAFLAACLLQLLVFALVDPQDLNLFSEPLGLSRQATYSLGFLLFWAVCIAGSAMTALLTLPPSQINRPGPES